MYKTPLPSDRAWSRASKKVGPLKSIDQGTEKIFHCGPILARFCMGILSLSKKKAPIGLKIFFSS